MSPLSCPRTSWAPSLLCEGEKWIFGVFHGAPASPGRAELSFLRASLWWCLRWAPPAPSCPQALLPPLRDSTKASSSFKRTPASNIDYTELLQHFDRVQNKHLDARHQRAGRAEQLDRRVVL